MLRWEMINPLATADDIERVEVKTTSIKTKTSSY